VAPGLNEELVGWCTARGVPVLPGVATPSENERGLRLDLKVLKFFPAETLGGVGALKALSAPYGGVRFMPTGGITAAKIGGYLALPSVLACGGSWMIPKDAVAAKDWPRIEAMTREAVAAAVPSS